MMTIKLKAIKISDLVKGFEDKDEEGVVGYSGKLNIRPQYQREFVYSKEQQIAVIESVFKNFPLNVMYWVKKKDGTFDLLDGQQRTLSLCTYASGKFSVTVDGVLRNYNNLLPEHKKRFNDYELQVYICENGEKQEQLDWFKIVNIAGETLTDQELLNAVYTGPWVTDAKKRFSKTGCNAYKIGKDYMTGTPIRQDYLEKVLKWISPVYAKEGEKCSIESYMAQRQNAQNADREYDYYDKVIKWVKKTFTHYRQKEMKGLDWGLFYNKYKKEKYDADKIEKRIVKLMEDDSVTKKSGIYEYILDGNEKHLSIRAFSPAMARAAYERQKGICPKCKKKFKIEEMQADHIKPWSKGGATVAENCQMLCAECNRTKSNK